MTKKIHFSSDDATEALCGTPKQKIYKNGSIRYFEKQLRITNIPNNVTCEKCREILINQSITFLCPDCQQRTDTFIITQSVTNRLIHDKNIYAHARACEEKRTLISITCPICGMTTAVKGEWHNISADMRMKSYLKKK